MAQCIHCGEEIGNLDWCPTCPRNSPGKGWQNKALPSAYLIIEPEQVPEESSGPVEISGGFLG